MLTALRLLQSQFTISPVLYEEKGNNIIRRSVLFHRKIIHNIVLLQELANMFLHYETCALLMYYIRNVLALENQFVLLNILC